MKLADRDQQLLWHPFTQIKTEAAAIPIARAEGAVLYDEQGRGLIDAIASWWVNLHGHSHPHIVQRIAAQVPQLSQVIFAGFTHEPAVELAEQLLPLLPGAPRRLFFTDDGSTAVEAGLKMALQYRHNRGEPRPLIAALQNGYHGDTFGAMAASARGAYHGPYEELLFDVAFIDAPCAGREEEALRQLTSLLTARKPAAFIYEPLIQGAGGMRMFEPEPLDEMLKLCRAHGVFCIADEVMTGFGRTGTLFASQQLSTAPDIICLSKALTGGFLPLGAVAASEEIFSGFAAEDRSKLFWHGHSFTGNALACAAASASLELVKKPEFAEAVGRIEARHREFAAELAGHPRAREVRSKGLILACDVVSSHRTAYTNPLRDTLYRRFLEEGVLLRPLGNVVYVLPPVCISDAQLDKVYGAMVKVLGEV